MKSTTTLHARALLIQQLDAPHAEITRLKSALEGSRAGREDAVRQIERLSVEAFDLRVRAEKAEAELAEARLYQSNNYEGLKAAWAERDTLRTELADLQRYIDTQQRPHWERIQQALGGDGRPLDRNKSLCDEVVEAIAERDALRRENKLLLQEIEGLKDLQT